MSLWILVAIGALGMGAAALSLVVMQERRTASAPVCAAARNPEVPRIPLPMLHSGDPLPSGTRVEHNATDARPGLASSSAAAPKA
jgi:hypothetical protein